MAWVGLLLLLGVVAVAARHARADVRFAGLHPPPGRRIGVPGARIHAIDTGGEGPAVVFIHGNPGSALDFEGVMQSLRTRCRCIAVDRPGFGYSERSALRQTPTDQAKALHAALEELGARRVVLVGFSFGGPVAVAYALTYPDEVKALVLLAAVLDPRTPHQMGLAQRLLAVPGLGHAMAYVLGPWAAPQAVRDGYIDAFAPADVDLTVVERGARLFARPSSLLASANDWRTLERELPKLAERYRELTAPIELIWADADRIVGPAHQAAFLAVQQADAHAVCVTGAGHQLMSTHRDDVVAAVDRAVARAASNGL